MAVGLSTRSSIRVRVDPHDHHHHSHPAPAAKTHSHHHWWHWRHKKNAAEERSQGEQPPHQPRHHHHQTSHHNVLRHAHPSAQYSRHHTTEAIPEHRAPSLLSKRLSTVALQDESHSVGGKRKRIVLHAIFKC